MGGVERNHTIWEEEKIDSGEICGKGLINTTNTPTGSTKPPTRTTLLLPHTKWLFLYEYYDWRARQNYG